MEFDRPTLSEHTFGIGDFTADKCDRTAGNPLEPRLPLICIFLVALGSMDVFALHVG
jgi:hypothetical protein